MKKSVSGFTLVELVVVITIIATLAALAIPRYTNLQVQARVAKANAILGSVRAAAALSRAQCLVELSGVTPGGTCTNAAGTVTMDGLAITMVNQSPAATAAGIIAASNISAANDAVTVVAGNPILIQMVGATTPLQCQVSYTAATAVGNQPTISVLTTGC